MRGWEIVEGVGEKERERERVSERVSELLRCHSEEEVKIHKCIQYMHVHRKIP